MGVENRLGQPWFACTIISNTVDHNLYKSVLQSRVVEVD